MCNAKICSPCVIANRLGTKQADGRWELYTEMQRYCTSIFSCIIVMKQLFFSFEEHSDPVDPEWDSAKEDVWKHEGKDYILCPVCFFNLGGDSIRKPGASGFRKLKRKMQTNPSYNPISLFNFPYRLFRFTTKCASTEPIREIREIIEERRQTDGVFCCEMCAIITVR